MRILSTTQVSPAAWRRALAVAWALIGTAGLGHAHEIATNTCIATLPCSDPRGCPDLVVDPSILARDLAVEPRTFPADHCSVIEGEVGAGDRRLLIFTFNTPNLGPGDLIVGNPPDHPELFEFETCHGHPHFREYADYRLWTRAGYSRWQSLRADHPAACARDILAGHPEIERHLVAGGKRGFCVVDVAPSALPCSNPQEPFKYVFCDPFGDQPGNQGISVCWADEYDVSLDGQWIDITGLHRGRYVLEVEVNAERLFEEADYSNNATPIPVRLPGRNLGF